MVTKAITAIERHGDLAWTPEALKEKVERERALRSVVIEYFKSQLREGHHYYNLPGQGANRKPALAKEGGLNLCSLFEVVPEPDEPKETFSKDGHYSVRLRVHLRSLRTGQIVATGDGSCSTRESKYAYRWVWDREVPSEIDKETLPKRRLKTKNGSATQYRFANADLADQYNTVLKMADKRATVAAALKLPLVSELFTQDLEEQIAEHEDESAQPEAQGGEATAAPGGEAPHGAPAPSPSPVTDAVEDRKQAIQRLNKVFHASGMTVESLRSLSKHLTGKENRDEMTPAELTTLAAEIEGLSHSQPVATS